MRHTIERIVWVSAIVAVYLIGQSLGFGRI